MEKCRGAPRATWHHHPIETGLQDFRRPLTLSLTAIELSPAAGPHWQALNLNPNRNLARLRFLEIKSKITIKIGKKPIPLNSMAVGQGRGKGEGIPISHANSMEGAPLPSPPRSCLAGRGSVGLPRW